MPLQATEREKKRNRDQTITLNKSSSKTTEAWNYFISLWDKKYNKSSSKTDHRNFA